MTEPISDPDGEAPFFAVSLFKLAAMSFCTAGIYQLFWFYMNWCHVKDREQSRILPAWRALFALIFCYPLFWRMRTQARRARIPVGPLPEFAAVLFVSSILCTKLIDTEYHRKLWAIGLLSFLPLLGMQAIVNKTLTCLGFEAGMNRTFSKSNVVVMCIGGAVVTLALIGTFLVYPD